MGSKLLNAITSRQWWKDTAGACAFVFLVAYYGAWLGAGSLFESIISADSAKAGVVAAFTAFGVCLGVTPQVGDPTRARLGD